MNKKIIILCITSLFAVNTAFAEYLLVDPSDFTGDAFFTPPAVINSEQNENEKEFNRTHSIPPVKKIRLTIKKKIKERHEKEMKNKYAPAAPEEDLYSDLETSQYASRETEDDFDENMMPDGFEADEEAVEEQKRDKRIKAKKNRHDKEKSAENGENIVLDCDNMDYDTDTYCLTALGSVNLLFVRQNTTVKADKITFDRMNNTIKAEGNVRIIKNGQTTTGDYIFVDMNEENALIENPFTSTSTFEMKAQMGYVYGGNRAVQENGYMQVDGSYPINFITVRNGPRLRAMMMPKSQTLTEDLEKGLIKIKVKNIKITQKGSMEVLALKKAAVFKGAHKILTVPSVKFYTNKNNDFVETNSWELGSYRGLGMFIGPGFTFELPGDSVLKAVPFLNYRDRLGVGGLVRYQNTSNFTQAAYGTSLSKFLIRGKQKLDDDLYLQYGMNDYMNEWFLGRRRPKYGADLVYEKSYGSSNFLLKGHSSRYTHRLDVGYYHDMDEDKYYNKLSSSQIGTLRARYMAQAEQNIWRYRNEDKCTALNFDVASQLSAAIYGTGDTQIIGRIGPRMHTQYKFWMQDLGYFQSVYNDESPIPVFDAYRYGKSNFYLREYIRLNRYLTLSWFGSLNLSGDSPNDKLFQENAFYISFGPDDLKFHLGYDFIRENTYFTVEVMMDAKGAHVDYDRFELVQEKKPQKKDEIKEEKEEFQSAETSVLRHAAVEEIKAVDNVL